MSLHPIFAELLESFMPARRPTTVAALFVQPNGSYFGLARRRRLGRDARCAAVQRPASESWRIRRARRWCQLAYINQKRYGHKVGDDGGCFASALASVQRWGGVLEHPAFSYAWPHFDLVRPVRGKWTQDRRWLLGH
jgi:hypothetical protein